MGSTLEPPSTVVKDTGISAGGNIAATAEEFVARDKVNIYMDQRPVARARLEKLQALQQCIDHDVHVLIAVRSVLDQMSRLDSCLVRKVVAERHIGTLLVLVENVIDKLVELERLYYSEPRVAATQQEVQGYTISDIRNRLVALDQYQEAIDKLSKAQQTKESGRIEERFRSIVQDLKAETERLHQAIKGICDESADKARQEIAVLADVINELLPPDHLPRPRVEAKEAVPVQLPLANLATKWVDSAEATAGDLSLGRRNVREPRDG